MVCERIQQGLVLETGTSNTEIGEGIMMVKQLSTANEWIPVRVINFNRYPEKNKRTLSGVNLRQSSIQNDSQCKSKPK